MVNMEGCFGECFAENFHSLAKLLSDQDQAERAPSPSASRVTQGGPAGIGPQGIFPDVKVAEPKGANYRGCLQLHSLEDGVFEMKWPLLSSSGGPQRNMGC